MSLEKILLKFEPKPEYLLKVLREIQKENKYIGKKECERIAEYFSISLAKVYSLASFFEEIETKNSQKVIIKVCSGGPCLMKGSQKVLRQIEKFLHLEVGNDLHSRYKLEFISCRGFCDQGPVVMIGRQIFERVKPEDIDDIIKNYL